MIQKFTLSVVFLFFTLLFCTAQVTDSTTAITDSSAKTSPTDKKPKQKEIKKIEDPLLALSGEFIYNLKRMKPNQLLVIDERSVRNEKRYDDAGEEYEVTVTVRLGFSQDMITGIVKEVPLYQSNSKETNILYVKIPIKFCCTTPIDTLHTKKHCGKMSELNDFEERDHCKDWVQQEEAVAGGGGGKSGPSKTTKGGGVTGQTSAGGDAGDFGKPVPKGKKASKKGKNKKDKDEVEEEEMNADSTQPAKKVEPMNSKDKKGKTEKVDKKKDSEEDGFGKPQPKSKKKGKGNIEKEEPVVEETKDSASVEKEVPQKVEPKGKKDKTEKVDKKKNSEEEGFGKPLPKTKGKKKGKNETEKEEPVVAEETKTHDASEQSVDSTTQPVKEPIKTTNKKEKKKKG
jgi:hypothetical protein